MKTFRPDPKNPYRPDSLTDPASYVNLDVRRACRWCTSREALEYFGWCRKWRRHVGGYGLVPEWCGGPESVRFQDLNSNFILKEDNFP